MMKKRKVIDHNNLPVRLPIVNTIVAWIALEHWNASQVVYGAIIAIMGIIWIGAIVRLATDESVDIFENIMVKLDEAIKKLK